MGFIYYHDEDPRMSEYYEEYDEDDEEEPEMMYDEEEPEMMYEEEQTELSEPYDPSFITGVHEPVPRLEVSSSDTSKTCVTNRKRSRDEIDTERAQGDTTMNIETESMPSHERYIRAGKRTKDSG